MAPTSAILFAAATIFSSASAHMKMVNPPPYGPDSLDNSPLLADGSNFPCKNNRPDVFGPPKSTATMPIGAKQTLQLQGGATHGGGSCQISLTKDLKPTKDSQWMVIHSIEGGCPTSAAGNIGEDAGALDPTTFEYSIPDGIAPGNYALAWTWFNKIGNREMYMNCAPVTVTGGSKKRSEEVEEPAFNETMGSEYALAERAASFPPMFTANIPATDCTTTESTDVEFPNPGQSVVKNSQALKPPTGPKCGQGNAAPAGGSSGSAPSAAPPAAAPSGSAGSANSPGTATVLASPSAAAPLPSAAAAAPAPAAAAPSAAAPAPSAAAPATGGSSSSGCSEGAMMCSADGTQFGLCANGQVKFQPVAAGTKCTSGKIDFAKRSAKFRA
ncbi:MAG: hypothetical protein Q9191_006256 [Dirinaria sp. TL-2023a]